MKIPVEYNEMPIVELQQLLDGGSLTSVRLVEYYFQRIELLDKSGPELNSVLQLNPDVYKLAEGLDHERKLKGRRSMLHGIPVFIKGNIDTADKMETNAGSLALKGHIARKDAFIVSRLRDAGALILGKSNLSEWANFRSTRSSSGWSSVGGQTKNPYITDRSPCGSSSGSAVAVSSNLCSAAVGTETDGSIVCPSHMNGIVGIKPSLGLISRSGIIPISHNQDTAGPMGRTVADAAVLLDILAASDPEDPITDFNTKRENKSFLDSLDKNALKGTRIGVARNLFGFHEKVDQIMEQAIELMKKEGAIIIDPVKIETNGKYNDDEFEVLLYDYKEDLNRYLKHAGCKVKNIGELIEFNKREKHKIMPWFQQDILEKAQGKGPLTDKKYIDALVKCREYSREKGIDLTLKKHNLKAIIAPTGGPSWKIDLINGDHYSGGSSQAAAVSGYPHITVPAGFVFGLPVGISFLGGNFSDPDLIGLAYAFEQSSRVRREPEYSDGVIA